MNDAKIIWNPHLFHHFLHIFPPACQVMANPAAQKASPSRPRRFSGAWSWPCDIPKPLAAQFVRVWWFFWWFLWVNLFKTINISSKLWSPYHHIWLIHDYRSIWFDRWWLMGLTSYISYLIMMDGSPVRSYWWWYGSILWWYMIWLNLMGTTEKSIVYLQHKPSIMSMIFLGGKWPISINNLSIGIKIGVLNHLTAIWNFELRLWPFAELASLVVGVEPNRWWVDGLLAVRITSSDLLNMVPISNWSIILVL